MQTTWVHSAFQIVDLYIEQNPSARTDLQSMRCSLFHYLFIKKLYLCAQ